jgi:transcription elongation factor Elf1
MDNSSKVTTKKPKYYQCAKCGRFVKIIAGGPYLDDFGYWVTYKCKKCGVQYD